jgi:putative resolvase
LGRWWWSTADRSARVGVEHLEVVLAAHGRRVVVVESSERADGLVRDMVEVLTGMCAGLCGRRGARDRAMRAVSAIKGDSVDEVPV